MDMKKTLLIFLLLAVTLGTLSGQTGEDSFSWSLSLLHEGERDPVFTEGPVRLHSGDRIRFTLTSGADCFVSVIVRDAEGAVAVLHSNPLRGGETLSLGPLRITPPSGNETVFFVVSAGETAALRRALEALRASPGSARAGQELLNHIYGLRRDISRLRENPERPLALGGSFRGTGDDTGNGTGGILFSGASTYVKIITLEH
jgi:hypothetical protein